MRVISCFVISLFVFLVIFSMGCTSLLTDKIVGTWKSEDGSITLIVFDNGKSSWNGEEMPWVKYDDTHYGFTNEDTSFTTICTYDPQANTLTFKQGQFLPLVFKK